MLNEVFNLKKTVKVSIALVLCAVMVFSFTACGEVKNAEKTVTNYFTALCSKNFEESESYIIADEKTTEPQTGDKDKKDDPANDVFSQHFYDTFKYEILESEKVDKNTVNVKIKLNTADMTKILPEYLNLALQLGFASAFDEEYTDEKMNAELEKFMENSLKSENASMRETELSVKVKKIDGKWLIEADEKFADAVTGGMVTVANSLNVDE